MASARVVDTRPNSEVAGASAAAILAGATWAEDIAAVDTLGAEDIQADLAEVRSTIARWAAAPKGET